MNKVCKIAAGTILMLFAASVGFASDIYVAPVALGANNGVDCADAYVYTFVNSGLNWASTPTAGKISPNTNVHLCSGTYSASAGSSNFLVVQGSGTSGNPITLVADQGPVNITSPAWNGTVINLGTQSYITVNGDNDLIIQSTQNGTGLAYQYNSVCLASTGTSSDLVVEGVTCADMYVHTCALPITTCTDESGGGTGAVYFLNGSNVIISGNTFHDMRWTSFDAVNAGTVANIQMSNNAIYNVDHGLIVSGADSSTVSGVYIFGNTVGNLSNWDDYPDAFHHDPVHIWSVANTIENVFVYNNSFTGDFGAHTNSGIYLEGADEGGTITSCYLFNNIIAPSNGQAASGGIGDYSGASCFAANNTAIAIAINVGFTASGGAVWYNNIATGSSVTNLPEVMGDGHSGLISVSNYNAFAALPSNGNGFVTSNGVCCTNLAGWKAAGFDANAVASGSNGEGPASYFKLSGALVPLRGSPLIGAGMNLYSVCSGQSNPGLGALCSDAAGNPRPLRANWDIGAYAFIAPTPPNGLTGIAR